jgi:hypothetical protein
MSKPYIFILNAITIILSGFFSFMNLSEWYTVKILGKVDSYPFGNASETPYYYETAELYSLVVLIWGIAFFVVLALATWAIIKQKKLLSFVALIAFVLLIIAMMFHGSIGNAA